MIRRARLRYAFHLFFQQAIFAAAISLGGLILLLLLGTQVLNGYWLVGVFVAGLAAGLYRAKSRLLSPYELAQGLDQRLSLQDKISTAVYFRDHAGETRSPRTLIEKQRADAEQAARHVDLRTGLPFLVPKSLYAGSALALIAASIFVVRYGVTKSLDLHASLVQIAFEGLLGTPDAANAAKKSPPKKDAGDRPKEDALNVDPWQSKALDAQGPPDNALNTVDTPDVNNPSLGTEANSKANGTNQPDPIQQPGEANEEGDKSSAGEQSGDTASAANKDGSKPGKQPGAEQQEKSGNSGGENSSLADKMRDALSNLMSKLKQQKPGENSKSSQQSQAQQGAQKQGAKDEKGSPQAGKQSDAMSSPDQQGDQEGQSSDKAASAQNKSGKNSDKPPTQDGKSGVGKEDGDKSTREAEQAAAMGKITEIIGKRAQNMTGEVMVEVASGKQQLKTQYSQHKATHADAGGEINRDEVPLAYQQFVQQYFEEIRKAPAGTAKAKKTPGS
ncbi:MAG: hypothetical protein JO022_02810 [Acidobacteriaceae bacterium]|nr:hypothetical protein [Acidobacteriaceae bacterium]